MKALLFSVLLGVGIWLTLAAVVFFWIQYEQAKLKHALVKTLRREDRTDDEVTR